MRESEMIKQLRSYLMDTEKFNFLNLNEEILSDDILRDALNDAIADWNATPPMENRTLSSFNDNEVVVLKLGAVVFALSRLIMLNANNQVNYNDNGVVVSEFDKFPIYQSIKAELKQEYEEKKMKIKEYNSLMGAFGGVHSSYFYY